MLGGSIAIPARADTQLPASIASNTPRQSFGTWTLTTAGCTWAACGWGVGCWADWVGGGGGVSWYVPDGNGASGSLADCAASGADEINTPNASSPAFKIHPP